MPSQEVTRDTIEWLLEDTNPDTLESKVFEDFVTAISSSTTSLSAGTEISSPGPRRASSTVYMIDGNHNQQTSLKLAVVSQPRSQHLSASMGELADRRRPIFPPSSADYTSGRKPAKDAGVKPIIMPRNRAGSIGSSHVTSPTKRSPISPLGRAGIITTASASSSTSSPKSSIGDMQYHSRLEQLARSGSGMLDTPPTHTSRLPMPRSMRSPALGRSQTAQPNILMTPPKDRRGSSQPSLVEPPAYTSSKSVPTIDLSMFKSNFTRSVLEKSSLTSAPSSPMSQMGHAKTPVSSATDLHRTSLDQYPTPSLSRPGSRSGSQANIHRPGSQSRLPVLSSSHYQHRA